MGGTVTVPTDGGPNDGGPDSGTDTIVSGGDGSTDGPIKQDGGEAGPGKRFCQEVDAQFCADFDIPNDAGAGFAAQTITQGYALDFQSSTSKSPPVALKVTEPADAGGQATISTVIGQTDAGAMTLVTVDAEIFIPNMTATSTQPVFLLVAGVVAPQFQYGFVYEGKAWKLENFQSKTGPTLSGSVATNEWVHVQLQMPLLFTGATVQLNVTSSAGTATCTMPAVSTAPNAVGPYPLLLDLGTQTTQPPNQAAVFFFDNVVVHYL
jgi:hypothetical protein